MTMYGDDDLEEDELDLLQFMDDEPELTRHSADPIRKAIGGETVNVATNIGLGGPEVQDILHDVPPSGRSLLSDVIRLHQILGDSQPIAADLMADIQNGLRLHYLELQKAPANVFMGILSNLETHEQLIEMDKVCELITKRRLHIANEQTLSESTEAQGGRPSEDS